MIKTKCEEKKTYIHGADPCSTFSKLTGTLPPPLFDHFAWRVVIHPAAFSGGFDSPYPDGAVASAGGQEVVVSPAVGCPCEAS